MKYVVIDTDGKKKAVNSASGFPLGAGNYTVKGRKISSVSGFQVNLTEGQHVISDSPVSIAANAVTIPARSAVLIYDKADGTTGQVAATLPYSYIDNNTVGFWDFTNWDGTSTIPNAAVGYNGNTLAVVNPLTKTGTVTKADGYVGYGAQGDGSTGYCTSDNSANIPIGASSREINVLYTYMGSTGTREILSYGGASTANTGFGLYALDGELYILNRSSNVDTGYSLRNSETYLITLQYDGTSQYVRINGVLVYGGTKTINTAVSVIHVFQDLNGGSYRDNGIIHFLEIRNSLRTPKQISDIANALLLPNRYYTQYAEEYINGVKLYDIATPENAISGGDYSGYPKTNAFDKGDISVRWVCSQSGTGISGVAWIGQKVSSKIKHIRISNWSGATYNLSSVLVQYSTDNGVTWTTIQTQVLSTTASATNDFDVSDYTVTGTHYVRLLANANLGSGLSWNLPELQMYTDVQPQKFTDIRSILPMNAISLGFVRTGSSGVIAYNDSDYQYGRREKAYGGNRKVFLGWQYYSGATTLTWGNPFGTRKIRPYYVWAQDVNGTNEQDIKEYFYSGSAYGITRTSTSAYRIRITVAASSGATFNGADQTAGYIGCYAEVLDDD